MIFAPGANALSSGDASRPVSDPGQAVIENDDPR